MTVGRWRRSPLRLLRTPRLLAAAALVGAILGVVGALPLLFVPSVSSGALERQIAPLCTGTSINPNAAANGARVDRLPAAVASVPGFGTPIVSRASTASQAASLQLGEASAPIGIGTRPGFEANLDVVERADAGDLWVPDSVATRLAAHAGDTVDLHAAGVGEAETVVPVRIHGVFRDLSEQRLSDFWCSLQTAIAPVAYITDNFPPLFTVTDAETYDRLIHATGLRTNITRLEVPFAPAPTTLTSARRSVAELPALYEAVKRATEPTLDEGTFSFAPPVLLSSRLGFVTSRSAAIRESVGVSITPMAVVAIVAALGLAVALGRFWLDRRRAEALLLWVRGVSPLAIGGQGAVELALPVVVGGALGWGVARLAIAGVGPSSSLDPGTPAAAAVIGGAVVVGGLVVAAASAAWVARSLGDVRPRLARRRVPVLWEIPVLLLAWWSWDRLRQHGLPLVDGDRVGTIDRWALAFPLLAMIGILGLLARVFGVVLRVGDRATGRRSLAGWLAARRLAADHRPVALLFGLTALAVASVVFAAGLVASADATLQTKAAVFLGADTVVKLTDATLPPPGGLAGRVTAVGRREDVRIGGKPADLLVVDPATFASGSVWDDSFADESLGTLLHRLEQAPVMPDGAEPVIVVGSGLPSGALTIASDPTHPRPFHRVGTSRVFAAFEGTKPLLVARSGAWATAPVATERLLWTTADEAHVRTALRASGAVPFYVLTKDRVIDGSGFLPTLWTFAFFQALGAVLGALALGAVLVYAEARQRARTVAYSLSGRMGLRARTHWAALVAELAALTLGAVVAGATVGIVVSRWVGQFLDAAPRLPPGPLGRVPVGSVAIAVLLGTVLVIVTASLVQRAAGRADVAEVLRGDV